jgi:serine/threonine-protein kinase
VSVVLAAHYELERQLGEGAMAVVWAATDQRTGERVAIKCLKPNVVSADAQRRLKREARAIAAISHPNVVRVREVLTLDDGLPAIVMDLLDGESLRTLLDRVGRLSLAETADIMLATISAVSSAHAVGIVHRDLKPDNIYLVDDGTQPGVRVLDFGIAKVLAESDVVQSGALTSTGGVVGTPYYMAPEQVFGDKDLDARVDVWALGVVLFECLVGRRPIEGKNAGRVLRAITLGKVERLATAAPDLPREITSLVDRMLAHDRARRPGDLRAARDLLGAVSVGGAAPADVTQRLRRWSRVAGRALGLRR